MKEKIKKDLKDKDLSIKDLIDVDEWQKIQDNFSIITDVGLRTVDAKGNPLTRPSRQPRLCKELIKDSPVKEKFCGPCLPTFLGGRGVVDRNLSFSCHAGFFNFISPLRRDGGEVLGYLIVGPVILIMRKQKQKYRRISEEFNIDLDDFWSAILEVKTISFLGAQSLIELIRDVGEYTIKLAYQSVTKREEVVMAPDSPKLSRLLNALLDVAFQVSGADIGSIMFIDKAKSELTIRAAKGIPEEIVKTTRVRLGEGISGIAAKERESFLIDDKIRDNRIKPYLNRPYISSSMVLPINVEDSIMGVINLGALRTSSVKFNTDNVKLMNKLIDLATLALTPAK